MEVSENEPYKVKVPTKDDPRSIIVLIKFVCNPHIFLGSLSASFFEKPRFGGWCKGHFEETAMGNNLL